MFDQVLRQISLPRQDEKTAKHKCQNSLFLQIPYSIVFHLTNQKLISLVLSPNFWVSRPLATIVVFFMQSEHIQIFLSHFV